MSPSKTLFVSVAGGFVVSTLLHVAAFSVDNRKISSALLWQDTLFVYLTGPGPLLFVDEQGKPHYEGTPILALILPVGYIVSVTIYSLVTLVFVKVFFGGGARATSSFEPWRGRTPRWTGAGGWVFCNIEDAAKVNEIAAQKFLDSFELPHDTNSNR